jgi:hypothetical protein
MLPLTISVGLVVISVPKLFGYGENGLDDPIRRHRFVVDDLHVRTREANWEH